MGLFLYQRPEEQEQKQQEAEEQSLWQFQKHKLSFPSSMQVVLGEFKQLGNITVPVALMNCVVYVRAMVSVFCLGRLGSGQLAGGALSIGFTNITGYSILFGLASGMDPVCSQAFGSNNWELIGVSLQRMILILLAACLPISLLWLNLQPIMLWLGQDPSITSVAATYCLFSLPDLLTNSFIQPLRIYLRSQGITTPMMWCSAVAVVLHVPLNVILVFVLKLGVPGVAMAAVWTNINMLLFLLTYLHFSGVHKTTWNGWSAAALREWCPLLGLAVPSCFAICLEWWWYEIMTVLAGFLPNPTVAVATTAILIQTTSLMYTVPMALGSSVSTRVGNELGAGRPDRAQLATLVALGCAAVAALVHVLWTWLLRERWASVFTDDQDVVALAASVLPLMGLCELGNCPQTTGCGVLRGSARPAVGVRINLGSFYLLGTPVAVALAFWLKIGFGGLWYGLLVAQIACAASILLVVFRTDWNMEASRAKQLAGCQQLQLSPKDANVDVDVDVDVGVAVDDDEEKALLPLMQ